MVRRRRFITAGLAATALGVAGCSGGGTGTDDETADDGDTTTAPPTSTGATSTPTPDEFGTAPPVEETVADDPQVTPEPRTAESDDGGFDSAFDVTAAYGAAIRSRSVGVVRLQLAVAPGVTVDTSTIRTRWVDPSGTYTLASTIDGGNADGYFGIRSLADGNGSAPVLDDPDDVFELVFDLGDSDTTVDDPTSGAERPGATAFGSRLRGNSVVSVQLAAGSGRSVTRRLEVPAALGGEGRVAFAVTDSR
jgi:hypothetical protein